MTFQVARIKRGQRLYTNSGCRFNGGTTFPAAVGGQLRQADVVSSAWRVTEV